MKKSTRVLIDKLLGYGFRQGEPDLTGKLTFSHANEPDTTLKVWPGISEARAHAVNEQARRIAGLGKLGAPRSDPKAGPKRKPATISKAEQEDRARFQREADARAEERREARAERTRETPQFDIERAIQAYSAGHQLTDCARRYRIGLEVLRAALIKRGYYRRAA